MLAPGFMNSVYSEKMRRAFVTEFVAGCEYYTPCAFGKYLI